MEMKREPAVSPAEVEPVEEKKEKRKKKKRR